VAYAFKRRSLGEIRVALSRLGGQLFVDVRLWVPAESEEGLVPTKKGICIPTDDLQHLEAGLIAVKAGIHTIGLAADRHSLGQEDVA
jgi:hypothetical protein